MHFLFIIFIAASITEIASVDIQSKIRAYFESQAAKKFNDEWRIHQVPFEYALSVALQEGYGYKSMNVYLNRFQNPLDVSIGYYHTDNQVKIIFQNMGLEELPHVTDVDIVFPLSSNALSVEASVSKMIVRSNYVLFRNKSDIIFSVADQDPFKQSPFRFQQVRNVGNIAISIEGCTLSGILIATLNGGSVNLGHTQLKLTECEYSLEIYSLGTGAPPVIAQYLPNGETGLSIEHLLMRPLVEELVPKLQASMFSYINTSSLFPKELSNIRTKQEEIFEITNNYMDQVVRSMNAKSMETNMGAIKLEDFSIVWDDTFEQFPKASSVEMSDMTLIGLDTLYSAHNGGPFRLTETEIGEQLRFGTLQVIGKISIHGFQEDNEFAVEISDLAVNILLDSSDKPKFEVVGWRFLEFSCPAMEFIPIESFVVGYLLNKIPKRVISHLNSVFGRGEFKLSHVKDEAHEQEIAAEDVTQTGEINYNSEEKMELSIEVSGEENEKLLNSVHDINDQVKLNHVAETSNEGKHGPVKLYYIDIPPPKSDDKIVKLNFAGAHPHEQVKLHNIAAPHEDDYELVKLHHVNVVPHTGENRIVKNLRGTGPERLKLNHTAAAAPEDIKIKLQHVAVEPDKENSNKAKARSKLLYKSNKSHKREARTLNRKSNGKKNNTIKRVNMPINSVRAKTSKPVNIVDNEINIASS